MNLLMNLLPPGEAPRKSALRLLLSLGMTAIGVAHFLAVDEFTRVVPDYLPAPRLLVLVSGACEIAGGLGLLIAPVRRAAAWGLAALYVAVFPANVYMATHHLSPGGAAIPDALLWGRLPLQALFIAGALWLARDPRPRRR